MVYVFLKKNENGSATFEYRPEKINKPNGMFDINTKTFDVSNITYSPLDRVNGRYLMHAVHQAEEMLKSSPIRQAGAEQWA